MAKVIHSMFRVLDLDKSINFYEKALDMVVADRISFSEFTLVYMRNDEADFEIELTHNHDNQEPYTHGSGYGHIAVSVSDLEESHSKLAGMQYEPKPIKSLKTHDDCEIRFFFVTDPDGYQVEFIERSGRFSMKKY
ncbi:MAG: VOC family protein [Neptuniibacter sp.]